MKITKSTVEKLTIRDVKNLDPVAVMIEEFGEGQGKITITCFDDCWTYFWGAMGKQNTLATFFCSCDEHYLARKLKSGIDNTVTDESEDALTKALRAEIVRRRRGHDMSRIRARDLWGDADVPTDPYGRPDPDIFSAVFGGEWYEHLPTKPNPDYEYLCRIIKTVQEALRLEQTNGEPA